MFSILTTSDREQGSTIALSGTLFNYHVSDPSSLIIEDLLTSRRGFPYTGNAV